MSVAVKKKSESCADTGAERQAQPAEEQFGFEPTILCQEDWDFLMEVLENPPKPSEKLRAAWAKYHGSKS